MSIETIEEGIKLQDRVLQELEQRKKKMDRFSIITSKPKHIMTVNLVMCCIGILFSIDVLTGVCTAISLLWIGISMPFMCYEMYQYRQVGKLIKQGFEIDRCLRKLTIEEADKVDLKLKDIND